MITLMEMLRNEKADPSHGRPLSLTKVYMTNVMSRREAVLLAKIQKRDAAIARRQREKDLYEEIAKLAKGEDPKGEDPKGGKPKRGCANGVPTAAGQLGQQAIWFPPLDGGDGAVGEAPGAKNT
ncbi:hypothetical protein [Collinsella sp. TM09-10AT]|uniref:hypothetical protein n=1 Tax=Collinsella sp. TM09-10AT TaxID=2292343 RepID=UPI000E44494D|nr:hypothetical protein [Collinsella sp. TM09-10AT]RGJ10399.1 hypothetical protein DXD77_05420 [Collinsella sp. TM09-10AT]